MLKAIGNGSIQLPDFQRGWVWDNERIRALIASVSLGYPVGAIMSMETGGEGVRFSPRAFEGVSTHVDKPDFLLLDGQQRLTSLYLSFISSLQTRNSAAYKGIMGLLMHVGAKDFINGDPIKNTNYFEEAVDIHHIFPQDYCKKQEYQRKYWNSIINKAPLSARTNRILGKNSPSNYIHCILNSHKVSMESLDSHLYSHLINPSLLKADNFSDFIVDRAQKMLDMIEEAMGKSISGRDSEETIKAFGRTLSQ